jgi:hypothetical protein
MINIINDVFVARNHEKLANHELNIFALMGQYNYWVIICRDSIDNIQEEQIDLFIKAKEIVNKPQFDKNANLLILYKVAKIEEINRDISLQIEEDPFQFKKSVIYYTTEELSSLVQTIGERDVVTFIESAMLEEEVFTKHKSAFDNNKFESLLYRITHKIPFVKINIARTNNLESLEAINRAAVGESILNDTLESDLFLVSNEELNAMSSEDVLEKLKTIIQNEN